MISSSQKDREIEIYVKSIFRGIPVYTGCAISMYLNIHRDINRNDKQGTFITFITHHNAINQ